MRAALLPEASAAIKVEPDAAEQALRRHLEVSHSIFDQVSGQLLVQVDRRPTLVVEGGPR